MQAVRTDLVKPYSDGDIGTFKDSHHAPIHRWFKYPAGYSYKFAEINFKKRSLDNTSWIIDPFAGCGTSSVAAKQMGINSVGIEAHPFVQWVAVTKTYWAFEISQLREKARRLQKDVSQAVANGTGNIDISEFPSLVRKCFPPSNLKKLKLIRDLIDGTVNDEHTRDLFKLGLTDALRTVSTAGTGWPYIMPTEYHAKNGTEAVKAFFSQLDRMIDDLETVLRVPRPKVECKVILGDAREKLDSDKRFDLLVTSPPYLNNYDYADRTRLEMYFFGWARSWGEITRNVRDKLMMAATTQVRRGSFDEKNPLKEEIKEAAPHIYCKLDSTIKQLSHIRMGRGGRKSYDFMVAGYFNDMYRILSNLQGMMKPASDLLFVLGDSAPYGVYIPTEQYLGEISLGLGYSRYRVEVLRKRGDKWKNNPQRHKVVLKESVLTITS